MVRSEKQYPQSYYGLLAVLTLGPQTGYDIRKVLGGPEMFYWKESYGNIYPMLRALEHDGLVDKRESYVKTKKRIIYDLNPLGRRMLMNWLTEPAGLNRFRVEILMKIRFGASAGVENIIRQIAHYREITAAEMEEAAAHRESIRSSGDHLDADLRYIAASFFSHLKEAMLLWCDESLELMRSRSEKLESGQPEDVPHESSVVQIPSRELPPMK